MTRCNLCFMRILDLFQAGIVSRLLSFKRRMIYLGCSDTMMHIQKRKISTIKPSKLSKEI